jgi:hypothetical protein
MKLTERPFFGRRRTLAALGALKARTLPRVFDAMLVDRQSPAASLAGLCFARDGASWTAVQVSDILAAASAALSSAASHHQGNGRGCAGA